MSKPRVIHSPARRRKDDVEMEDNKGRKIYIRANATIPELLAAGVTDIGFKEPDAPLPNNYFQNT